MAGEPYVHQEFYDFSGGIQQAVGRILTSDNEFPLCINGELETVGPVSKIRGYQQRGSDVSTGYNILGAIAGYKSDGTMKQIAIADEGANSDAFTYNTINDTWTHHSLSLTSGAKAEIEYFLDGFFMVNFDDATRWNNYTQWYTTTNVTNAPKAKYIKLYGGRIYTAYVVDGGSTYPSRVIYSDLPAGTPYTIAWDNTTNYFDVDTDDKDVIKGLGLNSNTLLIFKENSLYRYNTNTLYKVPGAPGTVSQRSVKDLQGMTLYLHSTGIYMYDGSTSKLISRKIKDIIDGISTKNLTNACAYTKGDHYYVYVGDIDNTAKDIQIDKCLIDFDIAKNSLMLRSIEEEPTVFFTYRDDRSNITYNDATLTYNSADTTYNGLVSNQERIFFGTTDGEVHQQDTGNSFDGTDTKNGHTLTAIGTPTTLTTKFNGSVFLGNSSAYSAVDHADFQPTGNFTVGGWIKTSDNTTTNKAIFNSMSYPNYAGISFRTNTIGGLSLYSGKNTGITVYVDYSLVQSTTTNYCDGNWHFVVATFDGSYLRLYKDGNLDCTPRAWAYAPAYAATNHVRVGAYSNAGTNSLYFMGQLDEVSFFPSDALSLAEVQSLYAASITDGSNSAILAKAKAVYLFEDGAQLTDSTVNGHTLTAIGVPVQGTPRWGTGCVGLGTSQAFSAVDGASFQPAGNFSVSAWIRTTKTGAQYIFQSYSRNTAYAGLALYMSTTATLVSGKNTGTTSGTDYHSVSGSTSIQDGAWHHIVGTYDGAKLHLYIDGAEEGTGTVWTNAAAFAATNYVRVGCGNLNGTNASFVQGALDEVSFYPSYALSLAQVQSLYANSITHVTNTAILAKAKAVYLFEDGAQLTDSTVDGTDIAFTLETKDYYLGYPAIYKLFQKIHIFVNGVRAISVQYKLDDGDWKTLGKVKKTQSELIFPAGSRGKRIKFRILESSSGDRYAFEGFDLYFSLENLSD